MTPGARLQAAIDVLDRVLRGGAAERELTVWARGARYAGSKDRAAVRDHVFDALRRLRSANRAGGGGDVPPDEMDARVVLAGLLRDRGEDPAAFFTGEGHAPAAISLSKVADEAPEGVRLDVPDWVLPHFGAALGAKRDAVLGAMRDRADVVLRANAGRITRDDLIVALQAAGWEARRHSLARCAIRVPSGARGLAASPLFRDGLFEFQDAGSQALVDALPPTPGPILDLCAGGGGKALALAAKGARVLAHDADPRRMKDIPGRAARAGVTIERIETPEAIAPFDGVIADVPCSGSGAWRRTPDAKWRLTPERLAELADLQVGILDRALALARPGGWVAYMTCSMFEEENAAVVARVLGRRSDAKVARIWSCTPLDDADGFGLHLIERTA
ncbi:RsmB/NOP family class I SAM-dependent RNA methyltransferase [uncultured Jannaschia sp.]|uniref:RsmB/NOP family class I SAM-dependent RNA methyltransferase n=1 Tax=uncultured Jannaschia sp. TaxID=293347 RepID=UPI00260D503D|nr:RsmB/NOP family class I SAM-dependent RNA methyltransferase [uncultured Jannaschia sp.]